MGGTLQKICKWWRDRTDPAAPLPPLVITFRDYVLARRALTETSAYAADQKYWIDRLDDLEPVSGRP